MHEQNIFDKENGMAKKIWNLHCSIFSPLVQIDLICSCTYKKLTFLENDVFRERYKMNDSDHTTWNNSDTRPEWKKKTPSAQVFFPCVLTEDRKEYINQLMSVLTKPFNFFAPLLSISPSTYMQASQKIMQHDALERSVSPNLCCPFHLFLCVNSLRRSL